MNYEINSLVSHKQKYIDKNKSYSLDDALRELDQIKNIALNCFDKNGNPNLSAALRAIENKAKVAGLYKHENKQTINAIHMKEIIIDGEQLKLNNGEEFFE